MCNGIKQLQIPINIDWLKLYCIYHIFLFILISKGLSTFNECSAFSYIRVLILMLSSSYHWHWWIYLCYYRHPFVIPLGSVIIFVFFLCFSLYFYTIYKGTKRRLQEYPCKVIGWQVGSFGSPDILYIGITVYLYQPRASVWNYGNTIVLNPHFLKACLPARGKSSLEWTYLNNSPLM